MVSKLLKNIDIIVLFLLLAILGVLSVFIKTGILDLLYGSLVTFVIPGYLFLSILYPNKSELFTGGKIFLVPTISVIIGGLLYAGISYIYGFTLIRYILFTSVITIILLIILVIRRTRNQVRDVNVIKIDLKHLSVLRWYYLFPVIILFSAIISFYTISSSWPVKYTEFFFLKNGVAGNYPSSLKSGENLDITLGIINHEAETLDYHVYYSIDNQKEIYINGILVPDNKQELVQTNINIIADKGHHKISFYLFKGSSDEPYRVVYLWIQIT